jgi:hypothetical protein
MLTFRKIDVSDREWVCELLAESNYMGAEYSFANNMAWQRLSDSLITRYEDFYTVLMPEGDTYTYTFPAGHGDYVEAIHQLREYAEANGKKCSIFGVTREYFPLFESNFNGEYSIKYLPDSSDYVYLTEDLANLSGRKYHGKRNHLKKMDRYPWTFNELTEDDFEDCILLSARLYNHKDGYTDHSARVEQYAIDTFFKYYREFNLMGGGIRIDGELVAFTIGERLNSNTVVVHIEKADTSYEGLYVLINNQFVRHFCDPNVVKYINREEDLGIEGLRKAKRSYHPVFQVEKHLVEFF